MADINFKKVISDSITAAKQILGNHWQSLEPFAEHEFRQFAENAEFLAQLKLTGQIDDTELMARLEIQRLALKNVLLTIQGIGLIAAQEVVNAILAIVAKAVQTAINIVIPI
jgi:hypothetical protein